MKKIVLSIIIIIFFSNQINNILNIIVNIFKRDRYEITINGHKYDKNVFDIFKFDNKWVITIREQRMAKERTKSADFEKWCENKCIFNKYSKKKERKSRLETQYILAE